METNKKVKITISELWKRSVQDTRLECDSDEADLWINTIRKYKNKRSIIKRRGNNVSISYYQPRKPSQAKWWNDRIEMILNGEQKQWDGTPCSHENLRETLSWTMKRLFVGEFRNQAEADRYKASGLNITKDKILKAEVREINSL